jgi:hypothetical protein
MIKGVNGFTRKLLLCTTMMNNMELKKRERKKKSRHRFTWFDNVLTSTRVTLFH